MQRPHYFRINFMKNMKSMFYKETVSKEMWNFQKLMKDEN
jgi:hypothetical protein